MNDRNDELSAQKPPAQRGLDTMKRKANLARARREISGRPGDAAYIGKIRRKAMENTVKPLPPW